MTLRYNISDVVFYAAVFRAVQNLKAFDEEVEAALAKSQLGPLREMAKMMLGSVQKFSPLFLQKATPQTNATQQNELRATKEHLPS